MRVVRQHHYSRAAEHKEAIKGRMVKAGKRRQVCLQEIVRKAHEEDAKVSIDKTIYSKCINKLFPEFHGQIAVHHFLVILYFIKHTHFRQRNILYHTKYFVSS